MRKAAMALVFGLLGLSLVLSSAGQAGDKKEGKKEVKKDAKEGRKGTTIGVLVKKAKNAIFVQADGEEAPRPYVPQWRGGLPAKGGGLDKTMLKTFEKLKVGSRVEVQWVFEERLRALAVKVLDEPKKK